MSKGLKVTANAELFDRWKRLGVNLGSMAGIVQNDVEIPGDQIVTWVGFVTSNMAEFGSLLADTLHHLGYYREDLTGPQEEDLTDLSPEVENEHGGF